MRRIVNFDQTGSPWRRHDDAVVVGYSPKKLSEVGAYVDTLSTHAVVVVVQGKVLWEYGYPTALSKIASIRKSVLAMLYGKYVENGTIDLDLTLDEIDFDDVDGLMHIEKTATVKDIITSRSGVYHPASNPGDDTDCAPARGSKEPGSYFLYNNWDFNAAGAIFEKLTKQNIYDALNKDLVQPLGFEHWNREAHKKTGDVTLSLNEAYHMLLSTSDMARIGELMLREGNWEGVQVVPKDWVRWIVSVHTPIYEMNPQTYRDGVYGYGAMWWIWDGERVAQPFTGAYTAMGAKGQFITIVPELQMVVAYKTTPLQRTTWENYMDMLERLVRSKI